MVVAESDVDIYPGYDVVAIDPGVNFGMTIVDGKGLRVYNGTLTKQQTSLEYSYYAMHFIKDILSRHGEDTIFVLEGAAYHKTFGQVGLADVRCGFYLGSRCFLGESSIRIMAPMTARKELFGNGRYQAGDAFPTLNHNAADALGLALAAVGARMRPEDTGS